ncbi:MAG TPA: sensor histidine kinase N-terminal domain-containing protein [Methylophilaceae bacterium]
MFNRMMIKVNEDKGYSLRRILLRWLLLPLLTLFTIGTLVVYQIALSYSEDAYDRALYDSADDIVKLCQESLRSSNEIILPTAAKDVLLADQYDKVYYSVLDDRNMLLAGDGKLELDTEKATEKDNKHFYDTIVDGKEVRAISTILTMTMPDRSHHWTIVVGETRNKREHLADQIITGFVMPQIVIILLAALLVMFAVKRGLAPLESLRLALSQRSHDDLNALQVPNLPSEVMPLTQEINSLLSRIQSVFEVQKQFTADAAHQLRTPLAGLSAQTDFALEQENPPQTQHALDQIKVVASRLSHVVNQLLSIARNEPGAEKSLQMRAVDLNAFARDTTLEWVETAMKQHMDLGFEETDASVIINADPARLKELLDNLIDNALRYCPKGSRITVRVSDDATLQVEDNGPGIPPEERERVFERFHRLLGSEIHGNGLGLAIVREIAELHSASVVITEGAGGNGALFTVQFTAMPATETS